MDDISSLFSLEGKVAIVTGGGHGIGKGIAEALLKAGASVVIAGRTESRLEEAAAAFQAEGLPLLRTRVCDVCSKEQREDLIAFTRREAGGLDVLVNNAGGNLIHPLLEYPDESWNRQHELLLKGPFDLSRMAASAMKENGWGSIINITSVGDKLVFTNSPAYNSFKAGLKHLTKVMALDFAQYGIRVNNIGPGFIHSSMTRDAWENEDSRKTCLAKIPLGRFGKPHDLAGTVLLLASDAGAYITGQDFYVDGGMLLV